MKCVLEIFILILQLLLKSKIISKYKILKYPLQRVGIDLFSSWIYFFFLHLYGALTRLIIDMKIFQI